MKQIIFGGYANTVHGTNLEYNSLAAGQFWQDATSESRQTQIIAAPGTLSNFFVHLTVAPGITRSFIFKIRINGADSGIMVTIEGDDTTGSDIVNFFVVAAGDKVAISCQPVNGSQTPYACWSCQFESTNSRESIVLGGHKDLLAANSTRFARLMKTDIVPWAAASGYGTLQVMPTDGTFKNLYVEVESAPGDGESFTFTLRRNGGDTPVVATITGLNTTANSGANTQAVVAGDTVELKLVTSVGAFQQARWWWGIIFAPTIDGESLVLGGSDDALNVGAAEFNFIQSGGDGGWVGANEVWYSQLGQTGDGDVAAVLTKLQVKLSAAPGAGKSFTIALRVGEVDSVLAAPISDGATTGSDADTVTLANYDLLTIGSTPAGGPDVSDALWSMVGYIEEAAPPTGLENKSANMAAKMMAGGLI